MEELLKQLLETQNKILNRLDQLEINTKAELADVKQSLARIEHEHGEKISALFDGYSLRKDQMDHMQEHLDDRLDNIQTDLSYLVNKIAQQDRDIIQLRRNIK